MDFAKPARSMSPPFAFGAIAAIFVLFTAAASAPSPLYVVYQQQWGFSATTLTVVFAVYVVGLLASLLMLGALSDHVGRRPVLAAAILMEAASLGIFILADGVPALAVARVAQGIATGAAMTTLGATLVDLNPPHSPGRAGVVNGIAPLAGLALGALGCGALVQYAPGPTHLVYAVLLAGMAVAALVVGWMPETSSRRPGGLSSLRPRVGIPRQLRSQVFALVPILVASWALGGLYLSLGPSVAVSLFGLHSHLVGGLVVTLLCGTGSATAFLLRHQATATTLNLAAAMLSVGMLVTLLGVSTEISTLAAVGTVLAGVGFGASALGTFGSLARMAAPTERAELFSVALVISYVAFSVPAVVAGFATTSVGLHATAEVYGLGVVGLAVAALVIQRQQRRRHPRRPAACPPAEALMADANR